MNREIVIVFGGVSFEHEISIVSAIAMKEVLQAELHYVFLDGARNFYYIPNERLNAKLFSSGKYKKCDKLTLGKEGFIKKSVFSTSVIPCDVILNLIHSGDGEDGTLSAMFDFYSLPYIGPRKEACAISINKFLTKGYASSLNIKTMNYQYYNKGEIVRVKEYPVIVKPVRLGSSIGVSIVKEEADLLYALDVAYEYDNAIIIEPFVSNIEEYNVAGCKIEGEFVLSLVEEPQKSEFLDFEKKYLDFSRTSTVQEANISSELKNALKDAFKKIYNTLFDGSMIRCDFFVINNVVYLNEINPIPGSMSNYLYEDFSSTLVSLSYDLPKIQNITISYDYVNKIQSAKGK